MYRSEQQRRDFQQTQQLLFATIALPDATGFWLGGFTVILSVLLVCAIAASLGAGVLLAYGICLAMFRLFRIHATQVAARRVQTLATNGLRVVNH